MRSTNFHNLDYSKWLICLFSVATQVWHIMKCQTSEAKHIVKGFDGNYWIKMIREKTQKEISIPLLSKSANIIEKYQKIGNINKILPKISNQKFNSYLKEIAEIIGIQKNLTHHIARKTFATTVLLYNDVPMEIVSELLGHSKKLPLLRSIMLK
ncbi:tyrosine-type recombinase/integrase [Chryseobacterium indoltheticum]|uniref:tyrosine-type recombinase/integrase n=1 Tax=Chryseobacterium indoltheticum TaxID=254 RepID=UPI003F494895